MDTDSIQQSPDDLPLTFFPFRLSWHHCPSQREHPPMHQQSKTRQWSSRNVWASCPARRRAAVHATASRLARKRASRSQEPQCAHWQGSVLARRSMLVILARLLPRSTAGFGDPLHDGTARQDDAQHKEGQRVLLMPMNSWHQLAELAPASSSRVHEVYPLRSSSKQRKFLC